MIDSGETFLATNKRQLIVNNRPVVQSPPIPSWKVCFTCDKNKLEKNEMILDSVWFLLLWRRKKKNSSKPTWGGKGWLHLPCWVCHQGTWGQEPMPAAWSQELGLWREVTSWLTSFAGLSYFPYTTMDLGMARPTVGLAFPHGLVINRMLQGPQTCSQASLTELMTPQRSFPFSRSLVCVKLAKTKEHSIYLRFFPRQAW